ncbi:prohibitin family protein [Gloeobacter violaceus]|nr:prohibitin family protein [Gloeobacter violaceus]
MSAERQAWLSWAPQLVGVLILGFLLISLNPVRFVGNGENLVVFSWFGGIQKEPLQPGGHLILPVVSETIPFDVKTQALTWKDGGDSYGPRIVALTRDGQEIGAEVTMQFVVADPPKVYETLGTEYIDRIAPIVRSVISSQTSGFSAQDLYSTKRPVLQAQIRERVAGDLSQYGINVLDLLLRDVNFSKDFVAAIEAKTISENQLARKAYEIDQATQDAKTLISEAQAEAGRLGAKADALTKNPEYLRVVQSGVLGETLDTLINR